MKITVLGAGNGARAVSGDLALRGHEVRLWEHPAFFKNIEDILKNNLRIVLRGEVEGVAALSAVTADPREAVSGADIIYCVMPSFGQEATFDFIAPFVEKKQTIVVMPGNLGSVSLYMRLKKRGIAKDVLIGESDTIPYATRIQPDGSSLVFGLKECMWMSAMPGDRTQELISCVSGACPIALNPLPDVISAALANTNMILHCPTMIMNAGRIENGERFRFYNDGMTESVCRVMEAMDEERLAVGRAWGYDLVSEYEDAISNYGLNRDRYKSLREIFANHPVYGNHGPDSPTSMSFRYLTEDVPFLLYPLYEMGEMANVPTPVISAIIKIAEVIGGADYKKHGRGMRALGFEGLSPREVRAFSACGDFGPGAS